VGAAQLPEALSGPSPHARLTVHPHLNAGDVGVRPKPVDSRLDTLRIEHQILSRHRLACGAFRVIAPLVPAFHPPLRHLMKANASNLWRCHRHHGSQQHHRHLRRGLRHGLGLLDGVLQDKFSGFMVPCGLASRGLSKRLFFELPPGSFGLYFPPLALFLFQPMPQFSASRRSRSSSRRRASSFCASRVQSRQALADSLSSTPAGSRAHPRQLAQSGRDLFLHSPTQGFEPQ